MSARGGSHGIRRRSSSLTALSRPSIGVAGQRGAQRVSGAAFDSSVKSSGGNGGFRGSTLKRYGSQSALTSASKRYSAGGSSCSKDTRPFSDRLYREKMVRELIEFLTEHRYPHQIHLKGANGPSATDFRKIFEFLVCHVQPNFKIGPKLDESVMTMLKSLCYPFTISKSHLSTIGVQHTWPPVLAALSFIRTCIESVEKVDIESLLTSNDKDGEPDRHMQIYHKFVEAAYSAFLSGDDDGYQPLFADLQKKIESCSVQSADLELLEQETDRNRKILAELESQPNKLRQLENENETMSLDIEKLEKYVAGLTKWNSDFEANVHGLEEELQQKVNERDALAAEIQQKTYVASNQQVSGVDAQRINSQLTELKTRLIQADNELFDLDRDLSAEEQLHSQEKMSLVASVAECNRIAQMLQLIPPSAVNAAGFDYEMKPDLTRDESIRFETSILPALQMLSQHVTEKLQQREDDVAKLKEAAEQSSEVIADSKEECTALTNNITALDSKLEQTKESNAMKIQQLQSRIDVLNTIIASRNTSSALGNCQQLLQAEKDRLEAEKKDLQEKEDMYCRELLKYADDVVKFKMYMKENLPQMVNEVLAMLPGEGEDSDDD